jgi:predicted TIM-barrel enzyme
MNRTHKEIIGMIHLKALPTAPEETLASMKFFLMPWLT